MEKDSLPHISTFYDSQSDDEEEEDDDEEAPYCYADGKYSAPIPCGCPQPCRVPESGDDDDEEEEDEVDDDDEDDYKNYGVMAEAEDEEADIGYFDTIEEARIEMIKVVSQDLYERVVIFDTEDYNPDYDNIGTVLIVEEWDEEERMRDERNSMSHEDKPIKFKGLKKKKKK